MHCDWLSIYDNKWHKTSTIDTTVLTAIQYVIKHKIYKHSTKTKKKKNKKNIPLVPITYCTKIKGYVGND